MNKKERAHLEKRLLKERSRVVKELGHYDESFSNTLQGADGNLSAYSFHMADQGTDNFDREFALNLVSSEQDIIYEIDEALRRIDQRTYGYCELTGNPIEKERLKAIPYARNSVKAQSEIERGKTRYRPFGPTISKA